MVRSDSGSARGRVSISGRFDRPTVEWAGRRPRDAAARAGRNRTVAQKITPCLWFDGQAEEAAAFHVSLFEDAAVLGVERWRWAGGSARAGAW